MEPDKEEFERVLAKMEELQRTNPAALAEAMNALGIGPAKDGSPAVDASNGDPLAQLTESILKMRSADTNPDVVAGGGILHKKESEQKGILVTPEPGFAFKTVRLSDSMKVFVNICQHEDLEVPQVKKKLDENGEEVEGMNIPTSVGAARSGTDKSGVACVIYDIIVHPSVIQESIDDKTGKYRDFICQLGMQCIENKYKIEVDKRYKLPKLKYMGEIESQKIQDRKNMPKIQEVSSTSHKPKTAAKKKAALTQAIEVPDIQLTLDLHWLVDKSLDEAAQSGSGLLTTASVTKKHHRELSVGTLASFSSEEFTHPCNEYIEPLHNPPESHAGIALTAELNINRQQKELNIKDIVIDTSPFKCVVKIPGYIKKTIYFPCAVAPGMSFCQLSRPVGYISKLDLKVVFPLDEDSWETAPDAGSKPWLLAQALSGDGDEEATVGASSSSGEAPAHPYKTGKSSANLIQPSEGNGIKGNNDDKYPEDKFHLRLGDDVDQYTGVPLGYDPKEEAKKNIDGMVLPEDRFHQKDAASSFLINQREQAKKDKWEKHEKEKAERKDDPNVEYVDLEDFRPGGKHGPAVNEVPGIGTTEGQLAALAAAGGMGGLGSEVVLSAEEEQARAELKRAANVLANSASAAAASSTSTMSSTLWTELVD